MASKAARAAASPAAGRAARVSPSAPYKRRNSCSGPPAATGRTKGFEPLLRAAGRWQGLIEADGSRRCSLRSVVRREYHYGFSAVVPGEVDSVGVRRKGASRPVRDPFSAALVVVNRQRSLRDDVHVLARVGVPSERAARGGLEPLDDQLHRSVGLDPDPGVVIALRVYVQRVR